MMTVEHGCQLDLQTSHLPAPVLGDMGPEKVKMAKYPLISLGQLWGAISRLQLGQLTEPGPHAAVPCLQKLPLCVKLYRLLCRQATPTGGILISCQLLIIELWMVLDPLHHISLHSRVKNDRLDVCYRLECCYRNLCWLLRARCTC